MELLKLFLNPLQLIAKHFTFFAGGPAAPILMAYSAMTAVKKLQEGANPVEALAPAALSMIAPGSGEAATAATAASTAANTANAAQGIDFISQAAQNATQAAALAPQSTSMMQTLAQPMDSAQTLFRANKGLEGIQNLGGMQPYVPPVDVAAAAPTPVMGPGFMDNQIRMAQSNGLGDLVGGASQALPAADGTASPGLFDSIKESWSKLPEEKKWLYGGLGGIGALSLMQELTRKKLRSPFGSPTFNYSPSRFRTSQPFAEGGIIALAQGGLQNRYVSGMGPLDQDVPNPSEVANPGIGYLNSSVQMMAHGGIADLGGYSDGGRLLKGPGDGMSDHIPAMIGQKQPARLADGEFVVPADVVSHLGNGSTDAGAKQLYAMMDRVRTARTGRKSQGKQINPRKVMVA